MSRELIYPIKVISIGRIGTTFLDIKNSLARRQYLDVGEPLIKRTNEDILLQDNQFGRPPSAPSGPR